jgi:hypothetical protein
MSNSEVDVAEWLLAIGTCRAERIEVIEDLLEHAGMDSMSEEDRLICRDALDVLEAMPDDGLRAIPKIRLVIRETEADDDELEETCPLN